MTNSVYRPNFGPPTQREQFAIGTRAVLLRWRTTMNCVTCSSEHPVPRASGGCDFPLTLSGDGYSTETVNRITARPPASPRAVASLAVAGPVTSRHASFFRSVGQRVGRSPPGCEYLNVRNTNPITNHNHDPNPNPNANLN